MNKIKVLPARLTLSSVLLAGGCLLLAVDLVFAILLGLRQGFETRIDGLSRFGPNPVWMEFFNIPLYLSVLVLAYVALNGKRSTRIKVMKKYELHVEKVLFLAEPYVIGAFDLLIFYKIMTVYVL